MNASKRSVWFIRAPNGTLSLDSICSLCRHRLSSRRSASTAAATQPHLSSSTQRTSTPVAAKEPAKAYRLLASPVLSRPPLITRDLTSFEKAFYLYQKRLNERLALPFTRYFYYKKGTPGDLEWKRKIKSRKTPARDIGVYDAYGSEGWNDEVLVGDKTGEMGTIVEALIRDAEGKNIVEGKTDTEGKDSKEDSVKAAERQRRELHKVEVERPMPRITEADEQNDLRSLNRKLDRTLFLLVKNRDGFWRFPEDRVCGRENLNQAAERILIQACGINMNTWIVGNHPIGYHHADFKPPSSLSSDRIQKPYSIISKLTANPLVPTSSAARAGEEGTEREEFGEKVFFMKARIMAGQADLSKNLFGNEDFRWLAKEEVKGVVTPEYWSSIRHMLAER
ncbi:hypothetical protein M433DRAFT_155467 [Acidomyces richmondensis BFW]|nr:MAG: hypothetical protein FE78DRAFT_92266 [Acidomyces sp. 'richmondensis']KYG44573.1 hypothetical protein M433DRAFT_155467 [Acidomyces richmondensis BFW]